MAKDMLLKHLWPKTPVKDSAVSYTVTSQCNAKLTIRRGTASSLACTVESSCSAKGGTKPRKSFTLLKAADFNTWWQKIRTVACECCEKSAWGKDL